MTNFQRRLGDHFPPNSTSDEMNLSIDFDGVLHDDYLGFHDGTCYGPLIEGGREALTILSRHFKIIILTAKAKPSRPLVNGKTGETLVWEWLREKELDSFISEVTSEKPRALAYIDDKGVKFLNWKAIFETEPFSRLKSNLDKTTKE